MLPALKLIGTAMSLLSGVNTVRSMLKEETPGGQAPAQPAAAAQSTPTGGASGAIAAGSRAATAAGEQQDRFLKLLVTQMRNQDPLNPLDNAQVTTQLAQISTVTGIDKLNATLQGLSGALNASQSLQSAALIGRTVVTPGNLTRLTDEGAGGALSLQQSADQVTVTVVNTAGQVVRTFTLGPQSAGVTGFQWDGMTDGGNRAANGVYVFQLAAQRGTGSVSVQPLSTGTVTGISLGADGMKVNTDIGDVLMSDIQRIL